MSGVPPRGPGKVTLVDAFSALLAAEQGDGSAEASLTAWGTGPDESEADSDMDVMDAAAAHAAPSSASVTSATSQPAPVAAAAHLSDTQLRERMLIVVVVRRDEIGPRRFIAPKALGRQVQGENDDHEQRGRDDSWNRP